MKVVLLAFLVVTATTAMVITSVWASTATFGLLQRTLVALHGTGYWFTVTQKSAGTTTIRKAVFLCVV